MRNRTEGKEGRLAKNRERGRDHFAEPTEKIVKDRCGKGQEEPHRKVGERERQMEEGEGEQGFGKGNEDLETHNRGH